MTPFIGIEHDIDHHSTALTQGHAVRKTIHTLTRATDDLPAQKQLQTTTTPILSNCARRLASPPSAREMARKQGTHRYKSLVGVGWTLSNQKYTLELRLR